MYESLGRGYGSIENWNTSNIKNMSRLFLGNHRFNRDISGWNVQNVHNMNEMFCGCENFNIDIGCWNVAKVKNMRGMFAYAYKFDKDLSSWNLSSVQEISYMFTESEKNYQITKKSPNHKENDEITKKITKSRKKLPNQYLQKLQ